MIVQTYNLQGNPPKWATETRWYYENTFGEQWIATLQGDTVIIAGSDIDWSEIILSPQQAHEALQFLMGRKKEIKDNPLMEWIFDTEEKLWITSVLMVTNELVRTKQKQMAR